jgi:hypothetical protein
LQSICLRYRTPPSQLNLWYRQMVAHQITLKSSRCS